jgi:hypothetical protein
LGETSQLFGKYQKGGDLMSIRRQQELNHLNNGIDEVIRSLNNIKAFDIKARKAKDKAKLKPKYTSDIDKINVYLEWSKSLKHSFRKLPKSVQ